MATPERATRRARRIAADEAHAWARNLRLNNPLAKLILSMLTQYVNGDGVCWVSVASLAEDCELAQNTIRDRLGWLEQRGAITRIPRWVDDHGHRNSESRGRRTSDDIRLMMDIDVDATEIRGSARRRDVDASATFAPSPREGSADEFTPSPCAGVNAADPSVALQRPFTCVQGLTLEPEPEPESPPTPSGGKSELSKNLEDDFEPEHFAEAWQSWPGHEVMRRDLALAEFRLLAPDKQRHCRAAIAQFVRMQTQLGRKHPPNFHLWIRNRGFEEFPTAATADVAATSSISFDAGGSEGRSIKALFAFARTPLFENRGHVIYPLPVTAQVLAFADAGDRSTWCWIEDRGQIAAWLQFLSAHIPKGQFGLTVAPGEDAGQGNGFHAPWPWPPRKDGTIAGEAEGGAA